MRKSILTILILLALAVSPLYGQRRVTPVTTPHPTTVQKSDEPKKPDMTHVVERVDAEGNAILVDTITGSEFVDSTRVEKLPRNIYPLIYSATAGVNIFDPLARILGQQYGGVDIWGEMNLHNRFLPRVVFGMGQADISPDGKNYTFKTPWSPYFKIGCGYNVFYNSNPDYQFVVGLMYGFSPFKYEITDVTVDEGYWDDPSHFAIPSRSYSAGWMEITFGIKVKAFGPWSLGWEFKYHSILHEGNAPEGLPMYIPGYGKRSTSLTASFSVMYTLPLHKTKTDLPPGAEKTDAMPVKEP